MKYLAFILACLFSQVARSQTEVGTQLYSFRNQFSSDLAGTVKKIGDMGIRVVEGGDSYGMPQEAFIDLLKKNNKVTAVFTGDGATSEGDFHEALNVAAVWDLPVIFLIENNGYGLSTPQNEQFRHKYFTDKGIGYGIETMRVDGNNILDVYDSIRNLAVSMRNRPRPVLVECMTFRMRGHEEASGTKYVPQHLFDEWAVKDPLSNYEKYLLIKWKK